MPKIIEISLHDHTLKEKNSLRHRIYNSFTQFLTNLYDQNLFFTKSFFNGLFYFNLDEHISNERIKSFLRLITFSSKPTEIHVKLADEKDNEDQTLMQRATYSGNTFVAALGLNFAYVIVHLVTLWGVHALWTAVSIILIMMPILAYVALSISDAFNAIKRNLIYEFKKKQKIEKINKLKLKLRGILASSDVKFKVIFSPHYHALTEFYEAQAFFEALKKLTRTTMLFTIVFALEIATGVPLEFLITSLLCGVGILAVDWRAQRKESRHDLKLRELNEQIVALTQTYIKSKQYQATAIRSSTTASPHAHTRLTELLHTSVSKPAPVESWLRTHVLNRFNKHLLRWDNLLAAVGITSGYVAFGFITTFNSHLAVTEGASILAEVFLFGIPGLFALAVIAANIYVNYKLHKSYDEEEIRLNKEIANLKECTRTLISTHSFKPEITAKLNDFFDHKSQNPWVKEYCQENKKWYKEKEAFKKFSRILTMSFLFIGASLLSSGGLIAGVIIFAVVIAALDYYVRKGKEEKELRLKNLQIDQLRLLKLQEVLVENFAIRADNAINLSVTEPSLSDTLQMQHTPKLMTTQKNDLTQMNSQSHSTSTITLTSTSDGADNENDTLKTKRAVRPTLQPAVVVKTADAAFDNKCNDLPVSKLSSSPSSSRAVIAPQWIHNKKSLSKDNNLEWLPCNGNDESNTDENITVEVEKKIQKAKTQAPDFIITTSTAQQNTVTHFRDIMRNSTCNDFTQPNLSSIEHDYKQPVFGY